MDSLSHSTLDHHRSTAEVQRKITTHHYSVHLSLNARGRQTYRIFQAGHTVLPKGAFGSDTGCVLDHLVPHD